MKKPLCLDLFCGAGGAARGYQLAGFEVWGCDIKPQPRYAGDRFFQMDWAEFLAQYGNQADLIHASPPCQRYTKAQKLHGYDHPDLIEPVRNALIESGKPYVIENVVGAPLKNPTVLTGMMFDLMVERRRLFETSFPVGLVLSPSRSGRFAKMGRLAKPGEYIHVAGKGGYRGTLDQWRLAMGIDWMGVNELAQAIPPAYTEFIGAHFLSTVMQEA